MVAARDLAPVKTPACENGRLSSGTFQKEEILTVLCTVKSGVKQRKRTTAEFVGVRNETCA